MRFCSNPFNDLIHVISSLFLLTHQFLSFFNNFNHKHYIFQLCIFLPSVCYTIFSWFFSIFLLGALSLKCINSTMSVFLPLLFCLFPPEVYVPFTHPHVIVWFFKFNFNSVDNYWLVLLLSWKCVMIDVAATFIKT